ncbi:hypothetical protein C8J57DRAFT_875 [Mycena rebaudengoi]|nr:hypothetical protein C8J57DRAFT_875 [Mycena rebaudengoi]
MTNGGANGVTRPGSTPGHIPPHPGRLVDAARALGEHDCRDVPHAVSATPFPNSPSSPPTSRVASAITLRASADVTPAPAPDAPHRPEAARHSYPLLRLSLHPPPPATAPTAAAAARPVGRPPIHLRLARPTCTTLSPPLSRSTRSHSHSRSMDSAHSIPSSMYKASSRAIYVNAVSLRSGERHAWSEDDCYSRPTPFPVLLRSLPLHALSLPSSPTSY